MLPCHLTARESDFDFTDKLCDQVSDAILDAHLRQDPFSHVSCQSAAKTGMILVCGDIISKGHINIQRVIRNTIKQIGYDCSAKGVSFILILIILSMNSIRVKFNKIIYIYLKS